MNDTTRLSCAARFPRTFYETMENTNKTEGSKQPRTHEQTHQVSFLRSVSLKLRKSESGGRILKYHYTIIVLRLSPRVQAHHVSGTQIKTPLKIASKVSKAPLCIQIILPEQQHTGCCPLPAPTRTHLFVLIRQIPSLLMADDISSKKHVRAKRQETADTHTQSETPVRPVQGEMLLTSRRKPRINREQYAPRRATRPDAPRCGKPKVPCIQSGRDLT